ncbi:hypothetical protein RRIM16_01110 [Rickettsia conorii subsp. raoultii]|nr:hypothetical protein RRIM16_01110 [Rickettsia conorii subsp. raoultii]
MKINLEKSKESVSRGAERKRSAS